MSADRPYFNVSTAHLEIIVSKNPSNLIILRAIRDELRHRRTRKAKELLRKVEGLLDEAVQQIEIVKERAHRKPLKQASTEDWIEALYRLTPVKFERIIIAAFNKVLRFKLKPTKRTGDGGVDGVGRDASGRKAVLQAKRRNPKSTIGTDDLRSFVGAMVELHEPDLGVFATTAKFSSGAERIAKRQGIILFDGPLLAKVMELAKFLHDNLNGSPKNPRAR